MDSDSGSIEEWPGIALKNQSKLITRDRLSLCKQIVASSEGRGSRFCLTIPFQVVKENTNW